MRCLHPISVKKWGDPSTSRCIKKSDGSYITITCEQKKKQGNTFHLVPCGKCVACLSRRRNDWTYRLMQEQRSSSYSFFLTLTYDDNNIPVSSKDGLLYYVFNKKDVQDYLKRIRYYISQLSYKLSCRYLGVSEYGGKTKRPHYHMQFFVYGDDGLKYHKSICQILSDQWTLGFMSRKPTNPANIHYVTKYCIKSLEQTEEGTIDETFILSSKKPYLGFKAEDTLEKQPFDQPVVFLNGMRQAMPRIYRNKLGFAGVNIPESDQDPRFSRDGYRKMLEEYRRTHERFSIEEFSKFCNSRLSQFEKDAIRRQTARNDKL